MLGSCGFLAGGTGRRRFQAGRLDDHAVAGEGSVAARMTDGILGEAKISDAAARQDHVRGRSQCPFDTPVKRQQKNGDAQQLLHRVTVTPFSAPSSYVGEEQPVDFFSARGTNLLEREAGGGHRVCDAEIDVDGGKAFEIRRSGMKRFGGKEATGVWLDPNRDASATVLKKRGERHG